MSRFDFSPVPSVAPTGPSNQYQDIRATPESFGAAIGRGEQKLGEGIDTATEKTLDFLTARQHLTNEISASETNTWLAKNITDKFNDFGRLQGKAAQDGLPKFKTDIEDLYKQSIENAGNNLQMKAMLAKSGRYLTDAYYRYGTNHADSQWRTWQTKTADDRAAEYGSQAAVASQHGNWDEVTTFLNTSDDEVRKKFESQGWSAEDITPELKKNRGDKVRRLVDTLSASGNPRDAQAVFDKYREPSNHGPGMDAVSIDHVTSKLDGLRAELKGRSIADQHMGRTGPVSPFDISAIGETGRAGRERQSQIAPDTKGSLSYGLLGLNSASGSAAEFAREHPQLGLTAQPGTEAFNQQWRSAAANNGDALYRAQQEWHDKHIIAPVRRSLTEAGLPETIANDPRVLSYMADRRVQMGDVGLSRTLTAASRAKSPEEFIATASATDKVNLQSDFRSYLADHPQNIQGLVNRIDKRAGLSGLSSGGPLPDEGHVLDSILEATKDDPRAQNAAVARMKLIYSVERSQQTQGKVLFDQRIKDEKAEALNAGKVSSQAPLTEDDFIRQRGAARGQMEFHEHQEDLRLGATVAATSSMSPDKWGDALAGFAPQPGPGYAAQLARQDALKGHLETLGKEMKADPGGYALRRLPDVKASYQGMQQVENDPKATDEARKAARANFAAVMRDEQTRMGIPAVEQRLLANVDAEEINGKFSKIADDPDPQARVGLVASVRHQGELWGENWPLVVQQLAPKTQPIIRAIAAGADPTAMTRLLSLGKDENPKQLLKEQDETKASRLTTALNEAFRPFLSSLVGNQRDRDFTPYYGLGETLAALHARDGDEASVAANKAFNELIGNHFDFRDTYRIPKSAGVSVDDIHAGTVAASRDLGSLGIRPAINDIGLEDNRADSVSKFARDGKWVTSNDNSGLNLVYGDKFVRGQDGKPLFLNWADLAARGKGFRADVGAQPSGAPVPFASAADDPSLKGVMGMLTSAPFNKGLPIEQMRRSENVEHAESEPDYPGPMTLDQFKSATKDELNAHYAAQTRWIDWRNRQTERTKELPSPVPEKTGPGSLSAQAGLGDIGRKFDHKAHAAWRGGK